MINAVRKFMKNDTNRIPDAGWYCECVWLNQQIVCVEGIEKHILCRAPQCASQFVRDGTVAVTQERGENGKKCELHYSVAKGSGKGAR